MPVTHAVVHRIDKKPDGSPSILAAAGKEMPDSPARDALAADLGATYNAKPGKTWGFFHEESGAYPFRRWLEQYLAGSETFLEFSRTAAEHLQHLLDESNLATGGPLLIVHYQQGMTDYLFLAMLHEAETVLIEDDLLPSVVRHVDTSALTFAARINLSEWQNNAASRQYISLLKPKGGRRAVNAFRDFVGVQEGVDAPGETRTLLKAFSDFVESEDLPEEAAREKTATLADYATSQAKIGGLITLDELSELIDEDHPKAFADFIRNKDYGLSPEIPPDKRTLSQFKRFTARAEGLSISFEAHLLGGRVEFDQARDTLTIRQIPRQLADQLKRAAPTDSATQQGADHSADDPAEDSLYPLAVEHVRATKRGSVSSVQRKLLIGYNRAARLVERMEREGVVAPMDRNGNREVLIPAA